MRKLLVLSLLVTAPVHAAVVTVSSAPELSTALSSAKAGDEIVLADGTYDFDKSVNASAEGTGSEPITVRAQNRLGALIRFNALEGFRVSGAHWVFDGLDVQGVCAVDSNCEHAFHVTGHAVGFVLRNSRVRDFNAQLKVNAAQNGSTWEVPNGGLVEHNEIADTHPRATSNPVCKLNIDSVDAWTVRDNVIHDFHKNGGDSVSYGAFMKGGGKDGVFERNLVLCTRDLTTGGTRIGLSFGGGGTGNAYCAPAFDPGVPCDPENSNGTMRNNVIVNCSDVGIYLNKAADTKVLFNTLIATSGVDFRFASSSGRAHGNLLASAIRTRDGATFAAGTNLQQVAQASFDGWYAAPLEGDLSVVGDVSSLIGAAAATPEVTDDYCGRPRPESGSFTLGALEHSLGECSDAPPDAGTQMDAGSSGEQDAGVVADAGWDGGAEVGGDAGTNENPSDAGDPSIPPVVGGCGCDAGSMGAGLPMILLAAGLALALRRKSSRARAGRPGAC